MQLWSSSNTCRSVAILLFDQFSNLGLANAVEPLRAANQMARQELYRWQFLSLDGKPVTSCSGLPVQPEMALSRHEGADYLFVMPSYEHESHATPDCSLALRAARSRYDTLVGMDMGSWLLAEAGLLDGRTATVHWDELVNFAETFPEVSVSDSRMVMEGDLHSCGGVTVTLEYVLALIEQHHGPMLRLEVASLFMFGEAAAPPQPSPGLPRHRRAESAVALMRRHIEAPLPVPEIARRIGLTQKALAEVFRRKYGRGPGHVYQAIRLREARRLVTQTGLSVGEIAQRCGYLNASAMTRAFNREFGLTPRDLRHEPLAET